VFINDPIGGVSYILNAEAKTAQKLPTPKGEFAEGGVAHAAMGAVGHAGIRVQHRRAAATQQFERESLGTKTIEGVQAEGTRTVFTIAAGEIGNERPIQTVTERWYSPQLQTVVLTKTSDPRMGETTYALTNINLAEPAHALFEVPADYNVVDGPQKDVMFMNRRQPRENK
jgi:hypothetical protein